MQIVPKTEILVNPGAITMTTAEANVRRGTNNPTSHLWLKGTSAVRSGPLFIFLFFYPPLITLLVLLFSNPFFFGFKTVFLCVSLRTDRVFNTFYFTNRNTHHGFCFVTFSHKLPNVWQCFLVVSSVTWNMLTALPSQFFGRLWQIQNLSRLV